MGVFFGGSGNSLLSTPTGAEDFVAAYNPLNPKYGALGGGADDLVAIRATTADAIDNGNGIIYSPILFQLSKTVIVPSADFKLPRISSVNTSTNVITFDLAHNKLTGDPILFQGAVPSGLLVNCEYYVNVQSSTTVLLYDTKAHALAGGSTGKIAISTSVTTTGSISSGSRQLTVAAEINGIQLGTCVLITTSGGSSIRGSSGGFYIVGGLGTGTLSLNTTATTASGASAVITYVAWIDRRYFDGGLKFIAPPGGGWKKHSNFTSVDGTPLLSVAIGTNVHLQGMIWEGLDNAFIPQGVTASTTGGGSKNFTVSVGDYFHPGMRITIVGVTGTVTIQSISGTSAVAAEPIAAVVSNAAVGRQISGGVYGITATTTIGSAIASVNSTVGLTDGLTINIGGETVGGSSSITISSVGTGQIILTGNAQVGVTNAVLTLPAGDDGVRISSIHLGTVTNCIFRHFGDAALRLQTNVADYSAQSTSDPLAGVNTGEITVRDNHFFNVHQTSTTTDDFMHGGGVNIRFEDNHFEFLRGSIKFANRVPGGRNLWLINNTITSSDDKGFEIDSMSDVYILNNKLTNIANYAIYMLPNNGGAFSGITATTTSSSTTVTVSSNSTLKPGMKIKISGVTGVKTIQTINATPTTSITVDVAADASVGPGAAMSIWGLSVQGFTFDGLKIDGNVFDNCGSAGTGSSIRIQPDLYGDGTLFDYPGIGITRNTFKNVTNTSNIGVFLNGGSYVDLSFVGNRFQAFQGQNMFRATIRGSVTSGFINGFKIQGNDFTGSNSGTTAVYVERTTGTELINYVDISGNKFAGTLSRTFLFGDVKNLTISNNQGSITGGAFWLTNSGTLSNVRIVNNTMTTSGTTGWNISSVTGLKMIDNDTSASSTTTNIAASCSNVTYINNTESGGGTVNFNSVPVVISLPPTLATKTADYTLGLFDDVILMDCTSGNKVATLFSAATVAPGHEVIIKKIDASANSMTVATTGGQTIDSGVSLVTLVQNTFYALRSDGSNWWVV